MLPTKIIVTMYIYGPRQYPPAREVEILAVYVAVGLVRGLDNTVSRDNTLQLERWIYYVAVGQDNTLQLERWIY